MSDALSLNEEQNIAVTHRDGHLLILAGAGTGKTRALVHRLGGLLNEGVAPEALLAITFTNKAAGELRERLVALVGPAAQRVTCGTFHGIAARMLRQYAPQIGLRSDFIIYDESDQRSLLSGLLKSGDDVTPGALIKAMDQYRLYPEVSVSTWDRAGQVARRCLPAYRQLLAQAGAVDFMGLIEAGVAMAQGGFLPRFAEVLVDEFQDTDHLQHQMLKGLADHGARVVVVGDDDQSIYGWRGAEPRGMLDFERVYEGADRVTLACNYRSRQVILDAANRLIAKNKQRLGKTLEGVRGAGDPLEVVAVGDDRAEGRTVVRQLKAWVDEGVPSSQLAVLTRTNAQLRGIEIALAASSMPYRLVGGRALFETKEVRDVAAYLRLWVQPESDLDLLRIINRPTRGLGKKAVEDLKRQAAGQPLLPWLRASKDSLSTRVRRGVERLLGVLDPEPADVRSALMRVLDEGGYLDWVAQREPERAEEREANLMSLVESADVLGGEDGDLSSFLEGWSLAGGGDLGRGEGVRMMTIHASKGLEFAAVVLPGWEEGLFPMPDPEGERFDRLEEERRLAYVALTRARDHALITWARARMHHGRTLPGRPSRFVAELAGDGVEGYAHHALDGRRPSSLVARPSKAVRVPAYDELAQADYGDLEGGQFSPGDAVLHAGFGAGVIQSIRGQGPTANVEVRFADGRSRTIRASYLEPGTQAWE